MAKHVVTQLERDHVHRLLRDGKRLDGRGFEEWRDVKVETGVITSAEGSARVSLGKTMVVAGVKIEQGEPYPEHPDHGVLTTSSDLSSSAFPTFDFGGPRTEAIELARVTDRGIRGSECMPLGDLCIEPGKKVWIVFLDFTVLDHDGNMFDAAELACAAALASANVPASKYGLGEDFPLKLRDAPVSMTAAKLGDHIVADPGLVEELVCDCRLTVTTDENGDVRAMQKGGDGSFTVDEVSKVINMAQRMGAALRPHIPR